MEALALHVAEEPPALNALLEAPPHLIEGLAFPPNHLHISSPRSRRARHVPGSRGSLLDGADLDRAQAAGATLEVELHRLAHVKLPEARVEQVPRVEADLAGAHERPHDITGIGLGL